MAAVQGGGMADVFISYASSDREHARVLAERLGERGFEVWWDRTIPPGRVFDEVIQEALAAAGSVIVLWSEQSVRSNWVKTEASEGLDEDKLVPALIEPVEPPMEFRRIQAADLSSWSGDVDHPEYRKLLASVEELLRERPPGSRSSQAPVRHADAPQHAPARRWRWPLPAGVLLAGLLVAGVLTWLGRRPAPVEIAPAESPPATARPQADVPASSEAASTAAVSPTVEPVSSDPPPAAAIAGDRRNLLAPANGGEIVTAPHEQWSVLIDGNESTYAYVDVGEGVFAFKDGRPATFDRFAILIPSTSPNNPREFELLAADDLAGPYRSIGKFATQNVRVMKQPFQEFEFAPTRARYVKLRFLNNYQGSTVILAYELQLHGAVD